MQTGAASVRQTARDAAERLENASVPEPVASAEVLLSELLDVKRGDLALQGEPLTTEQAGRYEAWIRRRIRREPVQRILGYAYFRNLTLELDESTLIPRSDTESVVDAALESLDRRGGACRVLDIGTGSGAIAISIAQERPLCEVHATDISQATLEVARRNARRAEAVVHFHRADIVEGLEELAGSLDLLVSNPPYISGEELPNLAPEVRGWDPPHALDGGPEGLLFYRRILAEALHLLAPGADAVLEVGDGQAEAVLELGRGARLVPLGTHPDLTGALRTVLLRRESG